MELIVAACSDRRIRVCIAILGIVLVLTACDDGTTVSSPVDDLTDSESPIEDSMDSTVRFDVSEDSGVPTHDVEGDELADEGSTVTDADGRVPPTREIEGWWQLDSTDRCTIETEEFEHHTAVTLSPDATGRRRRG